MIKADNISISFDGKRVIKNFSFEAKKAEYISVIGPNGSGKSTVLRAFCRITPVDEGGVFVSGKNIAGMDQKDLAKQISYIGQLPPNDFTVADFIMMSRYPYFSPFAGIRKKDRDVCKESMNITFTAKLAERKIADLSSGERQRVAIASALAQETGIMLFDEPTTHLDPYFDQEISELIHNIHSKRNITVINATHNLNNALKYSDRILALSSGHIAFIKETGDVSTKDMKNLFGVDFLTINNPADNKLFMVRV